LIVSSAPPTQFGVVGVVGGGCGGDGNVGLFSVGGLDVVVVVVVIGGALGELRGSESVRVDLGMEAVVVVDAVAEVRGGEALTVVGGPVFTFMRGWEPRIVTELKSMNEGGGSYTSAVAF